MPFVPIMGMVCCLGLMLTLPADTWLRLIVWLAIGFAIYFGYGVRNSVLQQAARRRHLTRQVAGRGARRRWAAGPQPRPRKACRNSPTRAAGSPVRSRSPMTATERAPASSTLARPLQRDPADRHDRQLGLRRRVADQLEADRVVARILARRVEDRPDRQVVDRLVERRVDLRPGVRRQPDDAFRAEHAPDHRHRHVVLPHMDGAETGGHRHVDAVVDDDQGPDADGPGRRRRRPARRSAPDGASLERSCRRRAPPSTNAWANAGTVCPARLAAPSSTMG